MLHKYQHFNPNTYQLDVKIALVKSGFHCKYNINYHLVWIPKYRKIVLEDQVKDELSVILTNECKELELELLALGIMPDHLNLFIGAKPHPHPLCAREAPQGCVINPSFVNGFQS
jgi:REP element-mobilizing transposase RayT